MRFLITLNPAEADALSALAASADITAQDVLRAALALAAADAALAERVREAAAARQIVPAPDVPGKWRGHDADDYRRAIAEAGSISGAARLLGVHRATVQEMVSLYGIPVPTLAAMPPALLRETPGAALLAALRDGPVRLSEWASAQGMTDRNARRALGDVRAAGAVVRREGYLYHLVRDAPAS